MQFSLFLKEVEILLGFHDGNKNNVCFLLSPAAGPKKSMPTQRVGGALVSAGFASHHARKRVERKLQCCAFAARGRTNIRVSNSETFELVDLIVYLSLQLCNLNQLMDIWDTIN